MTAVNNPKTSGGDDICPADWRVKDEPLTKRWVKTTSSWLKEQAVLLEALFVALSFHVLFFPLIWFVGWALPWPKSPEITTVIEINIENWPREARPTKIEELFDYKRITPAKSK